MRKYFFLRTAFGRFNAKWQVALTYRADENVGNYLALKPQARLLSSVFYPVLKSLLTEMLVSENKAYVTYCFF